MKWLSWLQRGRTNVQASGGNEFLWSKERDEPSNVPYFLPHDLNEINRLDFQHFIIRQAIQRNYIAPIADPKSVLDVGCGTGRWAHEMATAFPQAKVFGLDVTPKHEQGTNTVPTNYRFITGNVLEELPFPDMTFDFVHQRFLHMALPSTKWDTVVQELTRITRPGGWVELVESDLIMHNPGPAIQQLTEWGFAVGQKRGIDPRVCSRLSEFLYAARLTDIQKYRIDLPIGNWGGRLGALVATNLFSYNRAIKPVVVQQFKVPLREYDTLSEMMQKEWENNQSYFSLYLVCGRKQ